MIHSTSRFITSSLVVSNNAVKSLIFRIAELLLAFAVFKYFSLFAAKNKNFASYLMFTEDYIQKGRFIFSKGFSRSGMLVFSFIISNAIAGLFATFLWTLDSPGYILQSHNVSASTLESSLLLNPGYITSLSINPDDLPTVDDLSQTIGGNLVRSGLNFTLTGEVNRGWPKVVPPTRLKVGARIWLDDEGLSVSPDSYDMVIFKTSENGTLIGTMDCPVQMLSDRSGGWNCTFNNTFSMSMMTTPLGRPEVHWDDVSDLQNDSRYISPNRRNNIWASLGQGSGTSIMKQMFTVTKATRRHTFIETTVRITMVTTPDEPFSSPEILNLLKRTWSTEPEEQQAPLITRLNTAILTAQDRGHSYMYGFNAATDWSCWQTQWQYLTSEVDGTPLLSMVRISLVNITLIRSETLETSPVPFEPCDRSFQNEAYGGRVLQTDCIQAGPGPNPHFFGQVDTSAVMIIYGLGDGNSNISSKALDQRSYLWSIKNSELVDNLLVSRGFIVGVDPNLVEIQEHLMTPAMSYFQLFLVVLAAILAAIAWLSLRHFASSYWSNSLLSILLSTVDGEHEKGRLPGHNHNLPDIRLWETPPQVAIVINTATLKLCENSALTISEPALAPLLSLSSSPTGTKRREVVEESSS